MASCKPQWVELLTFGFIHECENSQQTSISIPNGIILYIINYFPVLYKFGLFDKKIFAVSEDKLFLKALNQSCSGYLIYADLYEKNGTGLNKGVHYWSIKLVDVNGFCYRSIGITTAKNEQIIEQNADYFVGQNQVAETAGYHYYYDGTHNLEWLKNDTFTIKLDCDNWNVSYYKNSELKRQDEIKCNENYFLVLSFCGHPDCTSLQIVETPPEIHQM